MGPSGGSHCRRVYKADQVFLPFKITSFPSPTPPQVASISYAMVLQNASNASIKDENDLPIAAPRQKGRVSKLYEEASLRRHAINNGMVHTPTQRAKLAKRRSSKVKKTKKTRSGHSVTPAPHVEQTPMEVSPPPSTPEPKHTLQFASRLRRPLYRPISMEFLLHVEPSLRGLSLPFIRDMLEDTASELIRALHNVKVENLVANQLPREIIVQAPVMHDVLPTHMLAVQGPPRQGQTNKITLYPVHSLILIVNCANINRPPPVIPTPAVGETQVTLPVWLLTLPYPQLYPTLSTYLYTKNIDNLIRTCFPIPPPRDLLENMYQPCMTFAAQLGSTCSTVVLFKAATWVRWLYSDVMALGIMDDKALWKAMDIVYKVLMTALHIATGDPTHQLPVLPSSAGIVARDPPTAFVMESQPDTPAPDAPESSGSS